MTTRLTALFATAALLLVACPPNRSGDDDDAVTCDPASDPAVLHACVYWDEDGEGIASGKVSVRSDPEEAPIEALTGVDGCVDMELAAGTWELSGANAQGDCVTSYEPYELVACETLDVAFYVMDWCFDGR